VTDASALPRIEAPSLEGRLPPPGERVDGDRLLELFLGYTEELGVELYPAQEEAILEVFSGHNVVLNTPTGSGKSLVALAVCFKALADNQFAFYTAPIKALVTEKFFELCAALGARNVGMMTGDASVNREAPIVCCTAEILANVALREGARAQANWVVMDEFHYYSDRDRGAAWQIPLLTLPQARFLLMSATLGKPEFFVGELTRRTSVPTALVRSAERPVPLDWEYSETPLQETVQKLAASGKSPIYIVHFSQRAASERAQDLMSLNFTTKEGKQLLKDELRGFRFDSPSSVRFSSRNSASTTARTPPCFQSGISSRSLAARGAAVSTRWAAWSCKRLNTRSRTRCSSSAPRATRKNRRSCT
jgi:superfamily II RNA helicase